VSILPTIILALGVIFTLGLGFMAFNGPSTSKAQLRRLESLRARHSKSNEVAAQAQLKRILQNRSQTKMDGIAQRLIPKPALLRKRLQQTGRSWTLGQYASASLGITLLIAIALMLRGMPILLALFAGL